MNQTPPTSDTSPRATRSASEAIPLVVAAIVFVASAIYLWDFSIDDVFISFRYAEHLGHGHGLAWNIGSPPVEGFSNFLWVIILGVFALFGSGVVFTAKMLGFILGLANLFLTFVLCRRLWQPVTFWWAPVIVVAATPVWAMWAMSGLEIVLYGFCLLVAALALTESGTRRTVLLSVGVFGLATTRPEGPALAAIPIVVGILLNHNAPLKQRVLSYRIPITVLLLSAFGLMAFRYLYFGYPFPNTVYAKGTSELASLSQVLDWLRFASPFLIIWAVTVVWQREFRYPAAVWMAVLCVIVQALIVLPVNPVMFLMHRYEIALMPLLVLPLPFVFSRLSRYGVWLPVLIGLVCVLWVARDWPMVQRELHGARQMIEVHRNVVDYLDTLDGDPIIALCDAGRIPFWSERPTYDVAGLCDEEWA
ncbi:MAG: hypothetical protein GF341_01600, partial [candidate division Zixibacteria bacterium]|nr:hypothetical protein [candidate division Zixibacteria bacterium]